MTTRRRFLQAAAATVAVPMIVPSSVLGENSPSGQITIGCIGVRGMGSGNMRNFMRKSGSRVVAVCDVDSKVLAQRVNDVNSHYKNEDCKAYKDYRELVAREDIDAV